MNTSPSVAFGLIAWLENTRITLPLKGVEARFDVRGDLVSVALCQIYHQDRAQTLDVLYTFPLPAGAAVYRCEMIVNDRVVSAKVMAADRARTLAAEKKAAGHRTALVESVRENLFELALGNLAPGDTVVIRLAWFQTLDSAGHDRSFRIPFTPGVRYIPGTPLLRKNSGKGTEDDTDQVPDASRLTPPRIDALHPDAAWVSIDGRIQPEGIDAARIASPSHTLVLRESDGSVSARLGDKASVPDRDFVLRLPAAGANVLTPVAWIAEDDGAQHALVRIIAPDKAPATVAPHDVYFLVDRSGSMTGEKWSATCRAFRAFLGNLAPQDRAWVTFFESTHRDLAEKPRPPAAILAEEVVRKLEAWSPDGGTELLPALDHVVAAVQKHSLERQPVIVLITDGQVGNESTIIARMKRLPGIRVFCYGIDTAVNDAFLRRLAAQQRGACFLATPQDDLPGTVAGLAAKLRHPVLTDIQPPAGWELPADYIPDLHAGDCLTVSLRRSNGQGTGSICFSAKNAAGEPAALVSPIRAATDPAIFRLWAKQRIEHLLESHDEAAAVELSERANIVCRATAFIAWDEAERLAISGPNLELYQPAMVYLADAATCIPLGGRFLLRAAPVVSDAAITAAPAPSSSLRESPPRRRDFLAKRMASLLTGSGDGGPLPGASQSSLPLIQSGGSAGWRQKLSALVRIRIPDSLLDWLEHWSEADPTKLAERRKLLVELASVMATHGQPVQLLCSWIRDNMEPAFRDPALRESVKAFGASAVATGK
jgi:Ca-activated chloride channel homolog